jgi:ABC-type uncharacterized transport system substrate-binding protein
LRFFPLVAKVGLFCLFLTPTHAYSQERILAVISNNGKVYQDFYSTLQDKLHKDIAVTQANISEINSELLNNYNYIVPIGYKAARNVSKYKIKPPVIYSLIPDNESLQRNISCKNTTCYKIYINQPVKRYIELFNIIFPKGKNIVLATTKENSIELQKIKAASKKTGIVYKEVYIKQRNIIARTLINELNANDVLLALPNSKIYNASNAKSIILSTYHANVPIIAYSKSFAKAGALVSLYSSIEDVAGKTANIVNKIIINGSQKQKEYYPDDFTIEINYAVARSLNISIEPENVIKRKIK